MNVRGRRVPILLASLAAVVACGSAKTNDTDLGAAPTESEQSAEIAANETNIARLDAMLLGSLQDTTNPRSVKPLDVPAASAPPFLPAGCFTASAGADAEFRFAGCAGPGGLTNLTGTIKRVASLSVPHSFTFSTTAFQMSGSTIDWESTVTATNGSAGAHVVSDSKLSGTTAERHALSRASHSELDLDLASACLAYDGSSDGQLASRHLHMDVAKYRRCGTGCPEPGGEIRVRDLDTGGQTKLVFDGSNQAALTKSDGGVEKIPMTCKAAEAAAPALAVACKDVLSDVYVTPTDLPPMMPNNRGDIVRCAADGALSTSDLASALSTASVTNVTPKTGVTRVRIAYRTERHGTTPGASTAEVLLPDHPNATPTPIIVVTHGTAGLAKSCAPSRQPPPEVVQLGLPFASSGYVVIEPDYAGLGNEGVQGYLVNDDTAHSVLDAARAARKLLAPGTASDKIVIVGHSQGGAAAIAAQASARSYGSDGQVVGVVAESTGMSATFVSDAQLLTMLKNLKAPLVGPSAAITTMQIAAGAAAAFGPDHAYDLFPLSHRAALAALLEKSCVYDLITLIPKETPTIGDLLDSNFQSSLLSCLQGGPCADPGAGYLKLQHANATAGTPDGSGPPVLLVQGLKDTTVSPALAACTLDSLDKAGVKTQLCIDKTADHLTTPPEQAAFALSWVNALLTGGSLPSCDASGLPACTH